MQRRRFPAADEPLRPPFIRVQKLDSGTREHPSRVPAARSVIAGRARYQGWSGDSCRRACSIWVTARDSAAVTRCSCAMASWVIPASPAR